MFKDYYLILGISKEVTAEDIEKAYKNVLSKMDDKTSPAYYQEVKEAFTVLSNKETKIMYDKELSAFNWSDGFGNHVIKDTKLASIINTLQGINKEKVADKRKSDEEGSPLQEESISYESTTDEQTPIANEPRKMSLFRRFVGSIIDKVILISVFVIGYVIISPYEAPSKLGSYIGLLKTSPDAYEYIDKVKIYKYNSGEYNKRVSTAYQDLVRAYSEPPHIGSTKENDLKITFSIIILNLLYFFLSELFLSASLGKRMLGGVLHDSAGDKIGFGKAFSRCLWFATLMAGIYYLFHLQIAVSNFAVLVIFFLLIDLPVLFTKRSLLDICTGTTYTKT